MAHEKHPTWFKLKVERRELIKALPHDAAVNVFLACLEYLETMEEPKGLSALEKIGFAVLLDDLKEAWSKYLQRVNARLDTATDIDRDHTISTDGRQREQTRENKRKDSQDTEPPFAAPTEAEVKAFCLAEGLGIDYGKFYQENCKRGWQIDGNPIRDWKALARAWADNEKNPRNYKKPDYTPVDPNKNPFAGYAALWGLEK